MGYVSNTINCPFTRGQVVVIPRGTVIDHRSTLYAAKRATKVTLHSVSQGWVNLYENREPFGFVHLPTITWAGRGGYWADVKVTPELCEALGVDTPTLPEMDETSHSYLDTIPSYGDGYDDRYKL